MAIDDISKADAQKYALEYIKKLADKSGKIPLDKLGSPPTVLFDTPTKLIFFSKVQGFLRDFAAEDMAYLQGHPELLNVKSLQAIANKMIDFADEHGGVKDKEKDEIKGKNDGRINMAEAANAIASFDPKTGLAKNPSGNNIASR